MGAINDKGRSAFRDFVTDGVPASGANDPAKPEIRDVMETIDAAMTAVATVIATGKAYATKTLMDADLVPIAGTLAAVYNDPDDELNGFYVKVGGTGTGSWGTTNIGFPASFAGDLSAITAELAAKADTADVTAALALKASLSALSATTGATLVGFSNALSGLVLRTLKDKLKESLSVKDFGAIGDGSSHKLNVTTTFAGLNTTGWTLSQWQTIYPRATALTQEIDFLAHDAALQNGGYIRAPRGTYRFGTDTLNFPGMDGVILGGDGKNATFWVSDSTTADIIVLSPSSPQSCQGVVDGNISSSVAKTAGAGIRFPGGHNYFSRNMTFGANMYCAYKLQGQLTQFTYFIEEFEINSGTYGFIFGDGTYGSALLQNVWVRDGLIYGTTSAGILLSNVSGFYIDNVDIGSGLHGINIAPGASQVAVAGWMSRTGGDSCSGTGITCYQPNGLVTELRFRETWSSSCAGNGVNIDGTGGNVRDIIFEAPHADNCGQNGIAIVNAPGVQLSNPQVYSNSTSSHGTYDGIYVSSPDFTLIGGRSGQGGFFNAVTQRYGLVLTSACTNHLVTNLNARVGNMTGTISDAGGGGTILACPGYTANVLAGDLQTTGDIKRSSSFYMAMPSGNPTIGFAPNTWLEYNNSGVKYTFYVGATNVFSFGSGTNTIHGDLQTDGAFKLSSTFYLAYSGSNSIVAFAANTWIEYNPSGQKYTFYIGGTSVMSVDSSGNVKARGTITPSTTP
jgi:hypothetical protein